jgi:hypothetical protein
VSLTADDVELVAQRAAELMRDELVALLGARAVAGTTGLVDALTVASALNVTRGFVYEHAAELGGRRIGAGPKAPWRFDLSAAMEAAHTQTVSTPEVRPRRRAPQGLPSTVPLLPIRGRVNGG